MRIKRVFVGGPEHGKVWMLHDHQEAFELAEMKSVAIDIGNWQRTTTNHNYFLDTCTIAGKECHIMMYSPMSVLERITALSECIELITSLMP